MNIYNRALTSILISTLWIGITMRHLEATVLESFVIIVVAGIFSIVHFLNGALSK